MGKKGDAVDGVLLLDKPEGMSSNWALQLSRRLINAQKAGHTGTLDPFATGLLPWLSATQPSIRPIFCMPISAMKRCFASARAPIRWIRPVR